MGEPGSADLSAGWLIADEAVIYAGFALMLAAIASCGWARERRSGWALATRMQASSWLLAAAGITLLATAFQLALQAAGMQSPSSARSFWASLASMATDTHVGRAAGIGMVALIGVAAVAASRGFAAGRPFAIALAAAGAAVFAAARSVVSHAGAEGNVSLAVGVLWLHLLLVCGWLGSVWLAAFSALSVAPRSAEDHVDAQAWLAALSATAGWLLLGIVLSGGFNVWRVWSASTPWMGTPYATVLAVKLGWVVMAAGLGAFNRFFRLAGLMRAANASACATDRRRAVIGILRIEAVVLLLALVASVVLGNTAPPDG